jgi:hypothetical protein
MLELPQAQASAGMKRMEKTNKNQENSEPREIKNEI